MFTDSDIYVMRKNPFGYFDKECEGKNWWVTAMEEACGEFDLDIHDVLKYEIRDCYGQERVDQLMAKKLANPNFPIAGKAPYLLELLIAANDARLELKDGRLKQNSHRTVCDMVLAKKNFQTFHFIFLLKRQTL